MQPFVKVVLVMVYLHTIEQRMWEAELASLKKSPIRNKVQPPHHLTTSEISAETAWVVYSINDSISDNLDYIQN